MHNTYAFSRQSKHISQAKQTNAFNEINLSARACRRVQLTIFHCTQESSIIRTRPSMASHPRGKYPRQPLVPYAVSVSTRRQVLHERVFPIAQGEAAHRVYTAAIYTRDSIARGLPSTQAEEARKAGRGGQCGGICRCPKLLQKFQRPLRLPPFPLAILTGEYCYLMGALF